jgi:hypothetical protein
LGHEKLSSSVNVDTKEFWIFKGLVLRLMGYKRRMAYHKIFVVKLKSIPMKKKGLTFVFFSNIVFCIGQVSLENGKYDVGFQHYLVHDSTRTPLKTGLI